MRVFCFDSLVLARLGRNYKCRTEAPDTHIITRFTNIFVFKAGALCGRQLFVEMGKVCFTIYSALLVLTRAIYVKSGAGKHNV